VNATHLDGVTFDCWGTLIFDRPGENGTTSFDVRVAAMARICGIDAERASAVLSDAWTRHHDAWQAVESYGSPGMAAYCLEVLGIDGGTRLRELTDAFEEASTEHGVDVVPGARDALEEVRRRGWRTALVCDTGFSPGRVVRRILDAKGFVELLDVLAFSDEVGVPKPHERMFLHALGGIGVDASRAAHVGDLRRTDIAGARALGMRTVRFRGVYDDDGESPDADVVIDAMSELPSALEGLRNDRAGLPSGRGARPT
jgi:FMN phosphatase YigB (HAD superfamily)